MILGECPCCRGWTVNPSAEKCSYCHNRVAPLGPLILREVPDGSRIDCHGKVFLPDGTLFYANTPGNPEEPDGPVTFLRELLLEYDEGGLPEMSVGYMLFRRTVDRIVDHAMVSSEPLIAFTSHCGPACTTPPDRIRLEIVRDRGDYRVTPLTEV